MKKRLTLLSFLFYIFQSISAQELLLPTESDTWGPAQTINLNDGGKIQLRTMFIKHYGTTCVFKIEFTNLGTKSVNETVQLINKDGIYAHWSTNLKLNTTEAKIYEMEKRECALTLGKKKQKDIKKCAECKPTIKFLKK